MTPSPNTIWRHEKSGTLYRVVDCAKMEADGSDVVLYRQFATSVMWGRPMSEFLDGRFTYVPSAS